MTSQQTTWCGVERRCDHLTASRVGYAFGMRNILGIHEVLSYARSVSINDEVATRVLVDGEGRSIKSPKSDLHSLVSSPNNGMVRTTEDREFFNSNDVSVSLTRFVVAGQTYAMSNITSVNQCRIDPIRIVPILSGVIGLSCLFGGGIWTYFGIELIIGATCIWRLQLSEHVIILGGLSGQVSALRSTDRKFVENVVHALNDCIVARG
jgi:hypothetical protein